MTKTVQMRTSEIGLFSGGQDSLVACSVAGVKEVIYCHTGVGLNEDYVIRTCKKLGWKLHILYPRHSDEYERFVANYGFPKATNHTWIMHNLKQKPVREWNNREKKNRNIIFISGMRKKESRKRFKILRFLEPDKIATFDGMNFLNPIASWSKKDVKNYIKKHNLEISPIYATLGMSGDCLCGAYSKREESILILKHHPELAKQIMDLEKKNIISHGVFFSSVTDCTGQRTLEGEICNECVMRTPEEQKNENT